MRKIVYEARFSLPAITAGSVYCILLSESESRKYWPLNEWELSNGTTQQLGVRKNQDSNTEVPVDSGKGKAEDFEDGISFTSMSIKNNGGGDTAADQAVLIVRKVVEEKNGA